MFQLVSLRHIQCRFAVLQIVSEFDCVGHAQAYVLLRAARLQVRATPHLTIHCKGVEAHVRTGANKTKLEAAVRRFYNTDKFSLPQKMLYPPVS